MQLMELLFQYWESGQNPYEAVENANEDDADTDAAGIRALTFKVPRLKVCTFLRGASGGKGEVGQGGRGRGLPNARCLQMAPTRTSCDPCSRFSARRGHGWHKWHEPYFFWNSFSHKPRKAL